MIAALIGDVLVEFLRKRF